MADININPNERKRNMPVAGEETDLNTPENKVRRYLNFRKMIRNEITKVVTMFTLFFLGSCDSTEVSKPVVNDVATYLQVGIDHNEALEKMFIDLKQAKSSGLTYRQAVNLFKQSATEITYKKYPEIEIEQMETIVNDLDDLILSKVDPAAQIQGRNLEMHEVILDLLKPELTNQQNTYLERIVSVATTGEPSLETIKERFDQLENEIRSEVSGKDAHPLLIGIYIGRASAQYWHDNHSKWISEFGSQDAKEGWDAWCIEWRRAIIADVAAGILVGVLISPALVVPFIGWGFWVAITGGSAAIVSGGTLFLFWYYC